MQPGSMVDTQVHEGFPAAMGASIGLLTRARRLAVLTAGRTLDEFGPALLNEAAAILARGGPVQVMSLGPVSAELALELRSRGVELRMLDEQREVGIVVSDAEVLLHPPDFGAESPVSPCNLTTDSLVAVASFQLAFDACWRRARPWTRAEVPEGRKAVPRRRK
jgi:hypothetical protein